MSSDDQPTELQEIENPIQHGLKTSELVINPLDPEQAELYVGRDAALEKIKSNLDAASGTGMNSPLRVLVKGNYGSGKTHTLMKIINMVKDKKIGGKEASTYYAKLTSIQNKTFTDIYKLIINDVMGNTIIIKMLFDAYEKLESELGLRVSDMSASEKKQKIVEKLQKMTGVRNEELVYVIQQLIKSDQHDEIRTICWSYLSGFTLGSKLQKLPEVNEDCKNPNIAIKNFLCLVALHNIAYPDKILIIAIDEMEKISKTGNSQQDYEEGVRQLVDMTIPIGFIFAETLAAAGRGGTPFMETGSLKSRIGEQARIQLDSLTGQTGFAWVKAFLAAFRPEDDSWKETCKRLHEDGVDIEEDIFPFERTLLTSCVSAVQADISPRTILRALQHQGSLQKNRDYFSSD